MPGFGDAYEITIQRRVMIDGEFDGGPVGLDTLSACTGEDPVTIEDVYEPYLMQIGYLAKTPRGRVLTRLGWEHLGLECPARYEIKLKGLGQTPANGTAAKADDPANGGPVQLSLDLPDKS